MKAIVPLNVAALRVSNPDSTNITPRALRRPDRRVRPAPARHRSHPGKHR